MLSLPQHTPPNRCPPAFHTHTHRRHPPRCSRTYSGYSSSRMLSQKTLSLSFSSHKNVKAALYAIPFCVCSHAACLLKKKTPILSSSIGFLLMSVLLLLVAFVSVLPAVDPFCPFLPSILLPYTNSCQSRYFHRGRFIWPPRRPVSPMPYVAGSFLVAIHFYVSTTRPFAVHLH